MPPPHRLAIVLSHPTQYYSPWFRWVAERTDVTLRVFYLWDFGVTQQRDVKFGTRFQWDIDLLSGYASEFVPNIARDAGTHHFWGLHNPRLPERLAAWGPTAVLLFGYNWHAHLRALAWARLHRIPVLFRGDSHFLGRGRPPRLKTAMLRLLYRQFAGFLPVGQANADYFRALGVPETRMHRAPHSVDAARFNPDDDQHRIEAARLREMLRIAPNAPVVLFAGKLVPEKRPRELLEAFLAVADPAAVLLYVGDGPEKPALLARAGADERVRFLPFANQSEMPARYLLADVFVLPSGGFYETWGLAVNEAMHMGVPALVSDRVGCQRDLVTPGETGWVFAADNPRELQAQLAAAVTRAGNPAGREQMRVAVRARIAGYTYAQTTRGLLDALQALPGEPTWAA